MKTPLRILRLSLALLALAIAASAQVEQFDKYVEASRAQWNVPGVSIAVVKDGKVLLSKGYGVRELGRTAAVDNDTLFGAMSTTKAMTAVAMGILVDEGKVAWDDRVIKHLPAFRVADPYVTSELRVRDLFTHNAGLGNADFLWARIDDLTPGQVSERMQYARQAYPFRGGFIYHNIMYLVAGQIIEKASGMTWERFMTTRVFTPLGMKDSYPTLELSKGYKNRSSSHYEVNEKIIVIPENPADTVAPAGAVQSTSDDIAKWVEFMLGDGAFRGKQIVKPATMDEMVKPQVIVPPSGFYPTMRLTKPKWMTYGLGWFQHDYRGEMVNFHTGSLNGRTAIVGLLRDKNLGVYIFGNLDHAEVRHALMYKAFDMFGFNDANGRDWSADMKALYDGIEAEGRKQREAQRARRIMNTTPTHPIAAYAGKYSDPFYGTMEVQMVGGKLRLISNKERSADLEHWQNEAFLATWNQSWLGQSTVSFQLNPATREIEGILTGGTLLRRQR